LPPSYAYRVSAAQETVLVPQPSSASTALSASLNARFRAPLIAYFGRRTGSITEAEDLTQDVFERVLRMLESRPVDNAEALIFRIAVNLLRDRARKAHCHGVEEPIPAEGMAELADALTVQVSPERVVMGEMALEEVSSALSELGERTRAIFCLYRLERFKIREIAAMYGISPSAVEKHVSKALFHLTRRMHPR
jgi:RNA polymerase sigma-70 factor (ECF subfamily)